MKTYVFLLSISIVLCLTACGGNVQDTSQSVDESMANGIETEVQESLVLADPQEVAFTASDGTELSGIYYPPANGPAPVVILMHQVNTDQSDWRVIAAWLQNRGVAVDGGDRPWLDSSWFPGIPDGLEVGVFTFTFRNCDGGCQSMESEGWRMDAIAALETAATLPNADPAALIAMGTSIGADGAVDACFDYNQAHDSGCLAAMPLSPGSYLNFPYSDAAAGVISGDVPGVVWCLASEGDIPSANSCREISDSGEYRSIVYPDDAHGLEMITPDHSPSPLSLLLDLLNQVLGD
jgi:hypothetical protein